MSNKIAGVRRWDYFRKSGVAAVAAIICLMLVSCAGTGKMRHKALDTAFDVGDFTGMAAEIKNNGRKMYGENSEFLFHMDLGVLYHYAGDYAQSNIHLSKAAEVHYGLFTRSVTNEAAALLSNDNTRPYRSKPYEMALLHQFAMLNYMALGDFDGSLVEARKVQMLFNEWERTRAAERKFHTDGMSHLLASIAYERTGEEDNSMISLFKSVEAFGKGPVKLPDEVAGFARDRFMAGDREEDIKRLGLGQSNSGNKWDAKYGASEIIIVAYSGRGPSMQENNWYGTYFQGGMLRIYTTDKRGRRRTLDLPAPPLPPDPDGRPRGVGEKVDIKISLPEMVPYSAFTDHFTAWTEGSSPARSVIVNDLELQAKKELDDSWGDIVGRTVIRAVIRTLAANKAKNNIDTGNPLANALLSRGTDAFTDQMEHADIRMCFLIPQRIHVIRMPVEPGKHNVSLAVYGKHGDKRGVESFSGVEVKRGEKKVLLYHSFN